MRKSPVVYTKSSPMKGADVMRIYSLKQKGYNAREIASILNRGWSSISNYVRVIDCLVKGLEINLTVDRYSEKAVIEFCDLMGLEYKPLRAEEKPVNVKRELPISLADEAEALAMLLQEFSARVRAQ